MLKKKNFSSEFLPNESTVASFPALGCDSEDVSVTHKSEQLQKGRSRCSPRGALQLHRTVLKGQRLQLQSAHWITHRGDTNTDFMHGGKSPCRTLLMVSSKLNWKGCTLNAAEDYSLWIKPTQFGNYCWKTEQGEITACGSYSNL